MTPTEIKHAALKEIGVLAAGESADADDFELATERYDALYEMLAGDSLVSWALTEDVPAYAELPYIKMLAFELSGPFQLPPQRVAELRAMGALHLSPKDGGPSYAETQLRRQIVGKYVSVPAQSEYF